MSRKITIILFVFLFQLGRELTFADSVQLTDKSTITGDLLALEAGFVLLRIPTSEGEVFRRIPPESIATLSFDDAKKPLEERAILRAKFQTLLSIDDARLLPELLENYLASGQALTALSYAKAWHPKNKYPSLDPTYRKILVLASQSADLPQEALIHSQAWLAQKPDAFEEPLPWQIIAQAQFDSGQFEAALWTSLQPIAHATLDQQDSLQPLHTIAAQAYQKLGYTAQARAHIEPIQDSPKSSQDLHPVTPPSLLADTLSFHQLLKTNSPK